MKTIYNLRKVNFTMLVNLEKNDSQFCAKYGLSKTTVSLYKNGDRNISDKKAREIELMAHKPEGWLDTANKENHNFVTPETVAVIMLDLNKQIQKHGISVHQLDDSVYMELVTMLLNDSALDGAFDSEKTERALALALAVQGAS
jgi:transcriptional regulator with XRE-family HTH domain